MRIGICTFLAMVLTFVTQGQVLDGDQRFPILNRIRWDLNKEDVLELCSTNKVTIGGNDSTVTFDAEFFGTPAKAIVRFRKSTGRPWAIEAKFHKCPEHLPDTLTSHFTKKLGTAPAKVEREKSVLLFTLRMEVSLWKTTKERITLMLAKQNKSIFEILLTISPIINGSTSERTPIQSPQQKE